MILFRTKSGQRGTRKDMGEWPMRLDGEVTQGYRAHFKAGDKEVYTAVSKAEADSKGIPWRLQQELAQCYKAGLEINKNSFIHEAP